MDSINFRSQFCHIMRIQLLLYDEILLELNSSDPIDFLDALTIACYRITKWIKKRWQKEGMCVNDWMHIYLFKPR